MIFVNMVHPKRILAMIHSICIGPCICETNSKVLVPPKESVTTHLLRKVTFEACWGYYFETDPYPNVMVVGVELFIYKPCRQKTPVI